MSEGADAEAKYLRNFFSFFECHGAIEFRWGRMATIMMDDLHRIKQLVADTGVGSEVMPPPAINRLLFCAPYIFCADASLVF
jgi:hypothetical protein